MIQEKPPLFTLSPALQRDAQPSPTLRINERVRALWAQGRTVYHMGFGESRFPVHPKLEAQLRQHAHQKSYLASQGLLPLRQQIARFYSQQWQRPITAEQVMVGPGSKALMYALQLALQAELILPTPSWVSYAPQARLLGRDVRYVPATPDTHYQLTIEALDQTLNQSLHEQKILLLNSPNNPTGQMLSPAFLEELADYCRAQRLVVLSDEIYGLVTHGRVPHRSIAHYYPEGTVVLGGVSKHLSLGGWRLGTAVLPDHDAGQRLMHALRTIASEIWSSPTAPVQQAAVLAYSADPDIQAYIDECTQLHTLRTQQVWQALCTLGINCPQPDGGFYLFPNFDHWRAPLHRRGLATADDLADYLLERYQLATLPGSAFGTPAHELSLRLATSYLDMESDEQATQLLQAYRAAPDQVLNTHHPALHEALRRFGQFIDDLAD